MADDRNEDLTWAIGYRDFFARKMRQHVLARSELPASRRPFQLFTLSNDAMAARIRAWGAYEVEVLGLISAISRRHKLNGTTALDIGANIGNHAIWMSEHFARVIAFEPHPAIAHVLRANSLMNRCENLHVVEIALSEREDEAVLVRRRMDHSGTYELRGDALLECDTKEEIVVKLRRGDNVLGELGDPGLISFIKLDIEGGELGALEGLSETLDRHLPIVCFESRNAAEGEAVCSFLRQKGYERFYVITATRLTLRGLMRPRRLNGLKKLYALKEIQSLPDRHHAAVFAWTRSL